MAHLHPFTDPVDVRTNRPTVMVEGDGCAVIDDAGNRYIDAASALWCASLGFSHERLIDAATAQMQQLPYYHNFAHKSFEPMIDLAEKEYDISIRKNSSPEQSTNTPLRPKKA